MAPRRKKSTTQQKEQEEQNEPPTPWKKSKAKSLLYRDVLTGVVPLEAKGEDGKPTMELKVIYLMHPEYSEYLYRKFSSRLSSLRLTVKQKIGEPSIPWKKSKARRLLYEDIMASVIPLEAKGVDGNTTMELKVIYEMRPEYSEYIYEKFSERLSSVRSTIKDHDVRAEEDERHILAYARNHPASSFSHKGYIQWEGSEAKELLKKDLKAKLHETLGKEELYHKRCEYYKNFSYETFRKKIYQEVRTAKYLHTCKVLGKLHRAS
jgi:hypothetical protein